ncbi:active regulator of SIRT1-like [Watersipora subatra]|uniref:active regulator of SIRT1-like n=1 Tax=Watersipora subatra TaxID=2589382 RepID=UPI00355C06B8
MSNSLVRRGLDLLKEDIARNTGSITIDKSSKKLTEKEIVQLVGTNKKGYKRKLKRLHTKRNDSTLKGKKVKPTQDLVNNHLYQDKTDVNINALNFLRLLNKDEKQVVQKAAERHEAKHSSQRYKKAKKEVESKTDSDSMFTEADFEKFFKEYNFT